MTMQEQQVSISKKSKQSLAWFTTLPMLLHFIRFANSILLARILSPTDFGIVGIATILLYYCNSLTEFGFSKAIIQRKEISQQHYNVYFTFNIGVSIFFWFIFSFFSGEIAYYFRESDLEFAIDVIAILFMISALVAVPRTVHRRNINFKVLAIAEALKVFISMIISLSLALMGYKFLSIIYAMVISNFIAMLLIRVSCTINPELSLRFGFLKDLLGFSIWNFIWGQSRNLSDNIDKIFIGRMLDMMQVGFFEKAQGFAKMPNEQFSRRLGMVSFSTFSRVQDNPEDLKNYFSKMMILNSFICFPLYIGLFVVAENFTLVLLGEKWINMIAPLKVLSISFLVASVMGPLISMNMATGQIKQQTLARIFGLVLLVIFLIWAVPYGIVAVSFVSLGFNIFLFVLSFIILVWKLDITVKHVFWCLYPAMLSTAILFVSVMLASNFLLDADRSIILSVEILTGLCSYFLCAILLPFSQWKFIRSNIYALLLKVK